MKDSLLGSEAACRQAEAKPARRQKIQVDMTFDEAQELAWEDGTTGICLSCGAIADGVEPDARGYRCTYCGEMRVFGLEECLIMDAVRWADE